MAVCRHAGEQAVLDLRGELRLQRAQDASTAVARQLLQLRHETVLQQRIEARPAQAADDDMQDAGIGGGHPMHRRRPNRARTMP